ncbi:hypothetical protein P9112_012599 [Eukaryota sp. TZLM1-RC]
MSILLDGKQTGCLWPTLKKPSGENILTIQSSHEIIDCAFSYSGDAVTCLLSNNHIYLVNLQRNSFYRTVPPASSPICLLAISKLYRKNRHYILASTSSEVYLLDPCATPNEEVLTVIPTSSPTLCISFHPSQPYFGVLSSTSLDVYNIFSCTLVQAISSSLTSSIRSPFLNFCFTNNFTYIINNQGIVTLITPSFSLFAHLSLLESPPASLRLLCEPSTSLLVTFVSNTLYLSDTSSLSSTFTIIKSVTFPSLITSCCFVSGSLVVVACQDGFRLLSFTNGKFELISFRGIAPKIVTGGGCKLGIIVDPFSSTGNEFYSLYLVDVFNLVENDKKFPTKNTLKSTQIIGSDTIEVQVDRPELSKSQPFSSTSRRVSELGRDVSDTVGSGRPELSKSQPFSSTSRRVSELGRDVSDTVGSGRPELSKSQPFSSTSRRVSELGRDVSDTVGSGRPELSKSQPFSSTSRRVSELGRDVSDTVGSGRPELSKSQPFSSTSRRVSELGRDVSDTPSVLHHYDDLLNYLSRNHQFPADQRSFVYKYLCCLPLNGEAFESLYSKVGASFGGLRKCQKLVKLLEALNPELIKISAVFDFSKLFSVFSIIFKQEIELFEFTLFLLFNYCRGFFDYRPHIPIHLLGSCSSLLFKVNPQVFNFLTEKEFNVAYLFWKPFSTFFSCWFNTDEVLRILDHILTHNQVFFLVFAVSCYSMLKSVLLALSTKEQVLNVLMNKLPIAIDDAIGTTLRILDSINPTIYFPPFVLNSFFYLPSGSDTYPALALGSPVDPNTALETFERIRDEESLYLDDQLSRLEAEEVRERLEEIQAQNTSYLSQLSYLKEMERESLNRLQLEESFKLANQAKKESNDRQMRFRELELKEERSLAMVKTLQESRQQGLNYLDQKVSDLRRFNNLQVESRSEEEALRKAQLDVLQRGIDRDKEIAREAYERKTKAMIDSAAQKRQDGQNEMIEKLRQEDELRAVRLKAAAERRRNLTQQEQDLEQEIQIEHDLLKAELERRAMERKIESEGRTRREEEEEMLLTEKAMDQNRRRLELIKKTEQENMNEILEQRTKIHDEELKERKRILDQEKQRRLLELEQQSADLERGESELKRRLWETEIREELKVAEESEQKEEERLKEALLEFEMARKRDRMKVSDVRRVQEELKNRLDFEREILRESANIRAQERDTFDRFRRDLRTRTDAELVEIQRRHSHALEMLKLEREKKLMELPDEERRKVYREMLPKLEEERKRLAVHLSTAKETHQEALQEVLPSPSAYSTMSTPQSTVSTISPTSESSEMPNTTPFQLVDVTAPPESNTQFRPQRVVYPVSSSSDSRRTRRFFLGSGQGTSSQYSEPSVQDTSSFEGPGVRASRFLDQLRKEAQQALHSESLGSELS